MSSETEQPRSASPVVISLPPEDIPGASLGEPFEAHAIPALKWWLLSV